MRRETSLEDGSLLEMSFTKHHMHSGATGNRTWAPKHHQKFTAHSVLRGCRQEEGSGLRSWGIFEKLPGIFMCILNLVCLQTTWWKCVSAFGLYCDFFLVDLYTLDQIFYLFLLIIVNKDLPKPNFFALGLRSYRRYRKTYKLLDIPFLKRLPIYLLLETIFINAT